MKLITIYVNNDPYTVDGSPMSGTELAMLAHDEHYDDYSVELDNNGQRTVINPIDLIPVVDGDCFFTAPRGTSCS